jgi:hypothetical protein
MAEQTIVDMLGAGSTQTATEFRISKAGLSARLSAAGYTFDVKAENTLDELVAAFICAGIATLTPEKRAIDPINRNIEMTYDPTLGFDAPTIDSQTFNRFTVDVAFYKPIPAPKLNPSDF